MAKISVRVRDEQDEWMEERNINKSALVRDLLDDYIDERESK